jgi:organic hydroperoxide reductase OsmC/OhrA
MSEHTAAIHWRNSGPAMDYERYPREHRWEFEGGPVVPASAAAGYQGATGSVDPEEALVASAAACHMLTFLAIASKQKFVVASYEDRAVGYMEKNAEGRLAITRIALNPQISFGPGTVVTAEALRKLHESAHRNCIIANSIKAAVTIA